MYISSLEKWKNYCLKYSVTSRIWYALMLLWRMHSEPDHKSNREESVNEKIVNWFAENTSRIKNIPSKNFFLLPYFRPVSLPAFLWCNKVKISTHNNFFSLVPVPQIIATSHNPTGLRYNYSLWSRLSWQNIDHSGVRHHCQPLTILIQNVLSFHIPYFNQIKWITFI